jgi:hypothetical protein
MYLNQVTVARGFSHRQAFDEGLMFDLPGLGTVDG